MKSELPQARVRERGRLEDQRGEDGQAAVGEVTEEISRGGGRNSEDGLLEMSESVEYGHSASSEGG